MFAKTLALTSTTWRRPLNTATVESTARSTAGRIYPLLAANFGQHMLDRNWHCQIDLVQTITFRAFDEFGEVSCIAIMHKSQLEPNVFVRLMPDDNAWTAISRRCFKSRLSHGFTASKMRIMIVVVLQDFERRVFRTQDLVNINLPNPVQFSFTTALNVQISNLASTQRSLVS